MQILKDLLKKNLLGSPNVLDCGIVVKFEF